MAEWAAGGGIELAFIEPGRPMQNGLVERFTRTYREDVLDACLFENLDQARECTSEYIRSYNNERPHDSLLDRTPREFLMSYGQLPTSCSGSRLDFPTFQYDHHLALDMSHLQVVAQ